MRTKGWGQKYSVCKVGSGHSPEITHFHLFPIFPFGSSILDPDFISSSLLTTLLHHTSLPPTLLLVLINSMSLTPVFHGHWPVFWPQILVHGQLKIPSERLAKVAFHHCFAHWTALSFILSNYHLLFLLHQLHSYYSHWSTSQILCHFKSLSPHQH